MRRDVIEDEKGRVEMRGLVDSDDTDALNAIERLYLGKGFTKKRTLRKVANVDLDELHVLALMGDKDALDFMASGHSDQRAFRRLLARNPQWRCSEGRV